jgi:hypothetical protein
VILFSVFIEFPETWFPKLRRQFDNLQAITDHADRKITSEPMLDNKSVTEKLRVRRHVFGYPIACRLGVQSEEKQTET